jgi:hypothetical protein
LKAVGEYLVNSPTRTDATLCSIKEKEGVFDMAAEEEEINALLAQVHGPMAAGGGGGPAHPQPIKADKNLAKRRKK